MHSFLHKRHPDVVRQAKICMVHLSAARRSKDSFPPPGALYTKGGGVRGHRRVFTRSRLPKEICNTVYTYTHTHGRSLACHSWYPGAQPRSRQLLDSCRDGHEVPGRVVPRPEHQLPLALSTVSLIPPVRASPRPPPSRMLRVGGGIASPSSITGPTGRGRDNYLRAITWALSTPSGVPARSMACHPMGTWEPMRVLLRPVVVPTGKNQLASSAYGRAGGRSTVAFQSRGVHTCKLSNWVSGEPARLCIFGFYGKLPCPCAMWTCVGTGAVLLFSSQPAMLLAAAAATVRLDLWITTFCGSIDLLGCMHALRTTDDTKRRLGWRSGSKGLVLGSSTAVQPVL